MGVKLETAVERRDRLEGYVPSIVDIPINGEAVLVNEGEFCLKASGDLDNEQQINKLTILRRGKQPAVIQGRKGNVTLTNAQNLNVRPEELLSLTFGQYSLRIKDPQAPSSITVEVRSFDRKPFFFSSFNLDKLKLGDGKNNQLSEVAKER